MTTSPRDLTLRVADLAYVRGAADRADSVSEAVAATIAGGVGGSFLGADHAIAMARSTGTPVDERSILSGRRRGLVIGAPVMLGVDLVVQWLRR
jgi:hypothetical protein